MTTDIETQFDDISAQYIALESDATMSAYELMVNWPSLVKLLPKPPARVLDYGAAGGVYARKMQELHYDVIACDNAPKMVAAIEGVPSFVWSYREPLNQKFDAVMCKLVLQFVEDLQRFAVAMSSILNDKGLVIVSIPHPDRTRVYAQSNGVHTSQVGQSDIHVQMIHRELEDYRAAFEAADFRLMTTAEPSDSSDPTAQPKRLNIVFQTRVGG